MRVQDLQIEDKIYKDLFQQQYLADGYNAAQHTLTTPRLASKKMTADKFNEPAANMESLQGDWFVGIVKYVSDLVVKFGTNVEYIMQDAGEYSDNTQYHLGQVVTYQGSKWICIVDTQITVPPSISGNTWLQVPNGVDGLSGVDFGVSDLYASSQDWDSAKQYSKNDLVYYATTDISNKPIRTMLFAALKANSGINPTSAGQTAWLKIFDQPATKIVISENEPVDKYTGQIWGEKSKMANYYSDGSPYYNLTMHQYNGSSWDDLYPKTTVANVVDGVADKLITDPTSYGQPIKEGTILGYENDTWTDVNDYSQSAADARYLKLSGGTVTGPLQIAKGTATNSAIRLDEIQNGVSYANGNSWNSGTFPRSAEWINITCGGGRFIVLSSSALTYYSDDGINWTKGGGIIIPDEANFIDMAYGDSKFVAITNHNNKTMYGENGTSWTLGDLPVETTWGSICYGGDKFVIVAKGTTGSNLALYSSDGIVWSQTNLPTITYWNDVCYGGGKFVAVSGTATVSTNYSAYSTDGINWTASSLPSTGVWRICYGNGKFVATNNARHGVYYSDDGVNWTQCNFSTNVTVNDYFVDPIYANNRFMSLIRRGDLVVAGYSEDGITWSASAVIGSGGGNIGGGIGKFIYVRADTDSYRYADIGISTLDGTASSSDISAALIKDLDISAQENQLQSIANAIKNKKGSTATIQASKFATEIRNLPEAPKGVVGTMPYHRAYYDVAYGAGKFVATEAGHRYVAYSSDGISWTETGSVLPSSGGWSICYGGGKFVAVAKNDSDAAYSVDGISWTSASMPSSSGWTGVAYGAGKYVAVSNTGSFAYSSNASSWTEITGVTGTTYNSVCYGAGKYVAITGGAAAATNYVATSTDGVNWTYTDMKLNDISLSKVCYGNGKFVVTTGDNSNNVSDVVAYSTDGTTWAKATMPNKGYWIDICYGGNKFFALAKGTNHQAYSTDGKTWVAFTVPSNISWACAEYGAGKFIALSDIITMMYIQDSHTTLG